MSGANNDVIQTLRTAHQNQMQLNLMADQKANILIGTLALMFTVVLTRMITLVVMHRSMLIVLAVFMAMELAPMVLTIMVLIPKNIGGQKKADIEHIINPLFFGFFTQYSQQQYGDYMQRTLIDNAAARQMLTNDIYQIGKILRRKYRLLRMAYLFTLLGVLVSVLLWATTSLSDF